MAQDDWMTEAIYLLTLLCTPMMKEHSVPDLATHIRKLYPAKTPMQAVDDYLGGYAMAQLGPLTWPQI